VRRIPLGRRSHITGFHPQSLGVTEHESALERDIVMLVRFADAAARITAQPVTIQFKNRGRVRRYTPDFLVHWSVGEAELVEVKYQVDLRRLGKQLRPRFIAARQVGACKQCANSGGHRALDPNSAHAALMSQEQPTLGELQSAVVLGNTSGASCTRKVLTPRITSCIATCHA
jgi:hypothetical protein